MDVRLAGSALQYHGPQLLRSLTDENGDPPLSNISSYVQRWHPREPEIKDEEFKHNLMGFIARKSDLLFRPLTEEEKKNQEQQQFIDDSFAIMPPLEIFMNVPSYHRREHFWKSLNVDDCVTGVVSAVVDQGLRLTLLCVDKGICRDIDDLNIPAFCPVKELPQLYAKESALDAFQKRDIVRGIVLSVTEETERIIISLRSESCPDENTYPRIGLITEEDFPVHYRRKSQVQDMTHEEMLQSILGFNNMGNVQALTQDLGVSTEASYFRFFSRLKIPEKEYAEGLKKWQSQKLAHQSVVQGVEMFKKGEYLEAMQHLNRALHIDAENVEALVARGALYANKENFTGAIKDFEEALGINPKHNNARNYLIETLLTVGKICEDRRELSKAVGHYEKVLTIEENHSEAIELLRGCRQLMAFQVDADDRKKQEDGDKRDSSDSGSSEDESSPRKKKKEKKKDGSSSVLKTSTDKLKALIKEDKERKSRTSKKDKQQRNVSSSSSRDRSRKRKLKKKEKKKKRKRGKEAKHRRSSSRSSSASSSDGYSSEEESRARGRSPSADRTSKKKKSKDKKHRSKKARKESTSSLKEGRSVSPEDSRSKRKGDSQQRNDHYEDKPARKASPSQQVLQPPAPPPASQGMQKRGESDPHFIDTKMTSFLPVSSFDFFNRSTAIPGLGSPSPPRQQSGAVEGRLDSTNGVRSREETRASSPYTSSQYSRPDVDWGSRGQVRRFPDDEVGGRRGDDERRRIDTPQGSQDWDGGDRVVEKVRDASAGDPRSWDASSKGDNSFGDDKRLLVGDGGGQMRRDEFLMAERKKFYTENREEGGRGGGAYSKFGGDSGLGRRRSSSRSVSLERGEQDGREHNSPIQRGGNKSAGSWTRSWSHSRSRSNSPHRPEKKHKGGVSGGAGSTSSRSPLVTGVKELDRYLGGAKQLIQRAMEAKGFSNWRELVGGEKRHASRSPSPRMLPHKSQGSRSPRPFSKSPRRFSRSPRQFSRSPKEKFSRSHQRTRSSRSPQKRNTSRSPQKIKASRSPMIREDVRPHDMKEPQILARKDSRSPARRRDTQSPRSVSSGGKQRRYDSRSPSTQNPPGSRSASQREQSSWHHQRQSPPSKRDSRSPMSSGRSRGVCGSPVDRRDQSSPSEKIERRDTERERSGRMGDKYRVEGSSLGDRSGSREHMRDDVGSFGKFGPSNRKLDTETRALSNEHATSRDEDRYREFGVYTEADLRKEGNGRSKPGKPGSAIKADTLSSFMPRILRKPRMDDPDVNKPLLSSNVLDKKMQLEKKQREKQEVDRGASTELNESMKSKLSRDAEDLKEAPAETKVEYRVAVKALSDVVKTPQKGRWDSSSGQRQSFSANDRREKLMEDGARKAEKVSPGKEIRVGSSSVGDVETSVDRKSGSLSNTQADGGKRSLTEEELEKEIERRVMERLKEEEKKKASEGKEKKIDDDNKRRYEDDDDDDRRKRYRDSLDQYHSRGNRGRGRGRGFRGRGRGGYNFMFGTGFHNRFRRSRSRTRSRSPGGRRSRSPRGRRSRSYDRRSRSPEGRRRSRSYDRRSSSSESRRSKHSRSPPTASARSGEADHQRTTPTTAHHGSGDASSYKIGSGNVAVAGGTVLNKDSEKLTQSKWDASGKASRWDDEQDVDGVEMTQGRGGAAGSANQKDSLTELERFLLSLKQQKKKQWIAEGKVKDK